MIDLETVEREISELEARETSYSLCERLAWLYIVRDHLRPQARTSSVLVPEMGGSDFLRLASGTRCTELLGIIDEHLETVRLLYPKTYESIMERVRELR